MTLCDFMQSQMYDNALNFFQRASMLSPKEPRYPMIVASCYRSMDCKQEALDVYERVVQIDPMNKQCLEHLIKLTNEMGMVAKSDYYQRQLTDINERFNEMQQEEMNQREEMKEVDLAQKPIGGMTATLTNNTLAYQKEKVETPSLKVGQTNQDVMTGYAGDGKDDIWEGVDLDLE